MPKIWLVSVLVGVGLMVGFKYQGERDQNFVEKSS